MLKQKHGFIERSILQTCPSLEKHVRNFHGSSTGHFICQVSRSISQKNTISLNKMKYLKHAVHFKLLKLLLFQNLVSFMFGGNCFCVESSIINQNYWFWKRTIEPNKIIMVMIVWCTIFFLSLAPGDLRIQLNTINIAKCIGVPSQNNYI